MLRDNINNAMKEAMKARDERAVSTLRMMNAAIKNADIEARGAGKEPLNEAELLSLFQKMIKQRQESAELYEKGGRARARAAGRASEIDDHHRPICRSRCRTSRRAPRSPRCSGDSTPQSMKDMGRAMAALKERFAGKMDFGKASGKIKELLSE